jgi:hypothetical protein
MMFTARSFEGGEYMATTYQVRGANQTPPHPNPNSLNTRSKPFLYPNYSVMKMTRAQPAYIAEAKEASNPTAKEARYNNNSFNER